MSEIKTAIGLMSGTSMDGIDIAVVRTDGEKQVERGKSAFFAYSAETRKQLEQALTDAKTITDDRHARPGCMRKVEKAVTDAHVRAVSYFLEQEKISAPEIDVIGFHGQTVLHRPQHGLTVQLGDGERLSAETRIQTVYDMRANDVLNGGQGAPLIPVYHQALAAELSKRSNTEQPIAFVNIGGISNITYLHKDSLIAFDTGPGNALIDQWVQQHVGISHDQGGMIAAEGEINENLLGRYLNDSFFDKPIPKSLDRLDFQLPETTDLSVETVARTLARVSAEAIFKATDHLPQTPNVWVICGGGRHNPHIMNDLTELALEIGGKIVKAEDIGLDGDAMEAEAWGYLAVRALQGLPLTYPQTTGCKTPVSGGVFTNIRSL